MAMHDVLWFVRFTLTNCARNSWLHNLEVLAKKVWTTAGSSWTCWAAFTLSLDRRGTLWYWTHFCCALYFTILSTAAVVSSK